MAYSLAIADDLAAVEKLAKPQGLRPDNLVYELTSIRQYTPEMMLNSIVASNPPQTSLANVPRLPALQVVQLLHNAVLSPEHEIPQS